MAEIEIRERQKDKLFTLLKLEKLNKGKKVIGLKNEIIEAKNKMSDEDIALVEKNIMEFETE
ncbi:MAG: hypothetical protein FWF59_13970 [Turicibacter sp.]|nr:hypothetical protein [Turicibacter sp.]